MTILPTLILRHKKENRKKCSLTPLEKDPRFIFLTYPKDPLIDLSSYSLLSLDGEELTQDDQGKGLCLIDATWRYAAQMEKWLLSRCNIPLRSLPSWGTSAYPRKQTACIDPMRGLSSIEALFIAFHILGIENKNLLDQYYWREDFLEKNGPYLKNL